MSSLDRHLNRGETILLSRTGHWGLLASGFFLVVGSIALVAIPGIAYLTFLAKDQEGKELLTQVLGVAILVVPWVALVLFFTGLSNLFRGVSHLAAVFALTNQRILIRTGLLSESLVEMPLSRFESIHVGQSFGQSLLGCGNIVVKGIGASALTFGWVRRPSEFRLQIQEQLENVTAGPNPVQPKPTGPPPLPSEVWYYSMHGQQHGPVSRQQLQQLFQSGQLQPQDLVWKEGMPNWEPGANVSGLV